MKELGIDRPYWVQYLEWIGQIVAGDLGKSYRYDLPAWEIIRPLLPVTLELAVLSILISVLLGVPTGVISAVRQDTALDYVAARRSAWPGSPCRRSGSAWSSSSAAWRGSAGSRR